MLVVLLGVFAGLNAQEGIAFSHGSWEEIKAEAKKSKKNIFIDCYTVWCGPCKALSRDIFPQKAVGDFFNSNFVNFKVDMEKGEGIELKEQFRVSAFPTLLWIDSDGELLHKVVGSMSADKLISEAEKAPEMAKQTDRIIRKYKRHRKSEEHVKAYLDYLIAGYDPLVSDVAVEYLQLIPENRYFDEDIFPIIAQQLKDPHGPTLSYLYDNQALLVEKFGKDFPSSFFYGKYIGWAMGLSYEIKAGKDFNNEAFQKLIDLMTEKSFEHTTHIVDQTQLKNLELLADWDAYMDKIASLIGEPDSVDYFNSVGIYLRPILNSSCTDAEKFKDCLSYVEQSFKNNTELDLMQYNIMWGDKVKIYEKLGDPEALLEVKTEKAFLQTLIQKEMSIAQKKGTGIKAMGMMGSSARPKKAAKLK